MKKYIRSSYEDDFEVQLARLTDARKKVNFLMDLLEENGVDEHEICLHFFDYLPADTVAEVLEDFVRECDLDMDPEVR